VQIPSFYALQSKTHVINGYVRMRLKDFFQPTARLPVLANRNKTSSQRMQQERAEKAIEYADR